MITIYSEKNIFEDIVYYKKNEYPNLREIFRKHANLYLNITEEDLFLELPKTDLEKQQPQSIIYNYILETGMKLLPSKDDFYVIIKDYLIITDKPRSIFFIDVSKEKAKQLQEDCGLIVQSIDAIDDKILSRSYKKELLKNEVYKNGWHSVVDCEKPPMNSIIIVDMYLLLDNGGRDKGKKNDYGKNNTIDLIDSLLPQKLNTDFHITIISAEDDRQVLKERIEKEIVCEIEKLRDYKIVVEVFWIKKNDTSKIEKFHKRRLLSNYINASSHYGFSVFKEDKGVFIVRKDNDFIFDRVFSNVINLGGNTEYDSVTKSLEMIKEIVKISKNRLLSE